MPRLEFAAFWNDEAQAKAEKEMKHEDLIWYWGDRKTLKRIEQAKADTGLKIAIQRMAKSPEQEEEIEQFFDVIKDQKNCEALMRTKYTHEIEKFRAQSTEETRSEPQQPDITGWNQHCKRAARRVARQQRP